MTHALDPRGAPVWTMADRLRKAREIAGYEQQELAAAIDLSRKTIGNYENGRTKPQRIVVKAWALACGINLGWLETGRTILTGPYDPEQGECAARDSNPEPADSGLLLCLAA